MGRVRPKEAANTEEGRGVVEGKVTMGMGNEKGNGEGSMGSWQGAREAGAMLRRGA